jgi:hypothetical protein
MDSHCTSNAAESATISTVIFWKSRANADPLSNFKVRSNEPMSLNDLEFAYAPVRNQVRDLREYL